MGDRNSFLNNLQSNVKNKEDSLSFFNTVMNELKNKKEESEVNSENK